MRNAFLVAWREFAENAKTKGFWIGLLMLPLILGLATYIPMLLEKKARPMRHYVLIDLSGAFQGDIERTVARQHLRDVLRALNEYSQLHAARGTSTNPPPWEQFADLSNEGVDRFAAAGGKENYLKELAPLLRSESPPFEEPRRIYNEVAFPTGETTPDTIGNELRPYLRGEKKLAFNGAKVSLDAAIIIPKEPGGTNKVHYWSSNLADKDLQNRVQEAVSTELKRREYERRGLNVAAFREVEALRVPIEELNPRKEAGQETVSRAERFMQWAPVGFVYLLWVAIFSISQMLLNNTIEEKSNRVIEVLLSSVTPAEYILGKLGGIAAVGLVMIGTWLGSVLGFVFWQSSGPANSEVARQALEVLGSSNLIFAFILYFVFGYLLYASIILAIGSVCNTLKEAQNYMAAITLLMMVPLLTMAFIPKDPNGTLATVLSWIPIYTPFVMMNRAAAHPPLFDLVGTMVLLIVSTLFALWMAVRVFRVAILRTGQPPRLTEIFRWMRSSP